MNPDEYRDLQTEKADAFEEGYNNGYSVGYDEGDENARAETADLKKSK